MSVIKHVNYTNQDGKIYCCLRNKVVKLDAEQKTRFCQSCKMFAGDAGGQGVECVWDDLRGVSDPFPVTDPIVEFIRNQARAVGPNYFLNLSSFCI